MRFGERQAQVGYHGKLILYILEADPVPLDAGIADVPPKYFLATGTDIRDIETEHFQAFFELFDGEIILVQHGERSFQR